MLLRAHHLHLMSETSRVSGSFHSCGQEEIQLRAFRAQAELAVELGKARPHTMPCRQAKVPKIFPLGNAFARFLAHCLSTKALVVHARLVTRENETRFLSELRRPAEGYFLVPVQVCEQLHKCSPRVIPQHHPIHIHCSAIPWSMRRTRSCIDG